jgi:dehydrogenase/reductase SDR family member 7
LYAVIGKKAGITESDILVLPVDITKMEKHQEYFNEVISYFGQLDILINNAGRSQLAYCSDIDMAVDRELFEGNVFGLLNLSRVVLPHFLAKKQGHLVVTSSICGKVGAPFSASYNATKHALHVKKYFYFTKLCKLNNFL